MSGGWPTFAEPQWAHAIWLVLALVALLLWLDVRAARKLDRLLSPAMQDRLVARPRRRWPAIVLIGLCGLFLVVALMRPQWGRHFEKTPRIGAQIMICLDVSKSMLAEDAAPNRLERAKAEITDLLTYLRDDHVGLIAFAGKATVLCPLTPDFGFYRMVLDSAGPQSVARGGTNLEAPIREALDGFRDGGTATRAIILITDGEDHDTHPLDAAKDAAERGIRMITIGFGDEAGSPIYVTDPRTGARVQLRDAQGQPVVTRLDGELLRQIAMETGGAYVPAGTGVLNLKSIYSAHIAPLTRGRLEDQGRLVKREGFQWPLLASLICLLAAAYLAGKASPPPAVMAAVCVMLIAPAARADDTAPPRQTYNDALALFQGDKLDDAERYFLDARRAAGNDVQVRFRAAYNLGWVDVKRADALLEEQPEQALEHLQRAADWFRDAVRLDPDDRFARENLQIITRRILALADALREKDSKDLAQRLDELIEQQRGIIVLVQGTLERVAGLESPNIPDELRDEFKGLETEQRQVLSDLSRFMQEVGSELGQLEGIEESERTPEQSMRLVQLSNMMYYLHDASQRIGQARGQLRRGQAERGYRRASAGLDRMKQARDMLRNIVEVLGTLLTEANSTARQTAGLSAATRPAWLTPDDLKDRHEMLAERTDVLFARMEAGVEAGHEQPPDDPEQQRLLERVGAAAPLVGEARDAFREAAEALDGEGEPETEAESTKGLVGKARDALRGVVGGPASPSGQEAYEADVRAIERLATARELFLDIRGLIEVMYADQKRMQAILQDEDVPMDEYLGVLEELQGGNLVRGKRLGALLEDEIAALDAPTTQPATPDEKAQAARQQHELAKQVLAQIMETFSSTQAALEERRTEDVTPLVDRGVEQVEMLRRLFFSIVEHLKETAQRQAELMDDTRDAAALEDAPAAPLAERQQELSGFSTQLSESLKAQSRQQGLAGPTGQQQQGQGNGQNAAAQLLQAAGAVDEAVAAMDDAAGKLGAEPAQLKEAPEPQQTALGKLIEAITLLEPPQQQQDQQQNQQQQGENQQQQNQDQEQEQQQQQQQQMDLRHLLQSVRDRAAERQRDRRREPAGYQPVEKDW